MYCIGKLMKAAGYHVVAECLNHRSISILTLQIEIAAVKQINKLTDRHTAKYSQSNKQTMNAGKWRRACCYLTMLGCLSSMPILHSLLKVCCASLRVQSITLTAWEPTACTAPYPPCPTICVSIIAVAVGLVAIAVALMDASSCWKNASSISCSSCQKCFTKYQL